MANKILALLAIVVSLASFQAHGAVGRTVGTATVSSSGRAQYFLPFALPPGRNGLAPQVGLLYRGSGGRGVAGLGWSIAGASVIARCEKTVSQDGVATAVRAAVNDGYCLDGNRLRLLSGTYGTAGSTYFTELNTFGRITAMSAAGNGPAWFKVETAEGLIRYYGDTADSRIEFLNGTTARAWALSRIEDRSGNRITFTWGEDTVNGAFRLEDVRYTGSSVESAPFLVDFQYAPRADVSAGYVGGSRVQQVRRLTAVVITHQGTLVRRYNLNYNVSPATARERLASVEECAGTPLDCLPPTTFTYQNGSIGFGGQQTLLTTSVPGPATMIDVNGDGRDDLVYPSASSNGVYRVAFANPAGGFLTAVNTNVAVHAGSIYGDYNLDGRVDILSPINGTWWVKLGTATGIAAPVNTGAPVTATGSGDNAALLDVNADGRPDLVWADLVGMQGGDAIRYRAGLPSGGFSGTVQTLVGPFVVDNRILAVYWGTPRKRLDFNGDGRHDVAYSVEERIFIDSWVYEYALYGQCSGVGGCWTGPRGPSAGNHPNFGDFNGDRKTDVFYWHQSGTYRYVFSTGTGTTGELVGPSTAGFMNWTVADWDGDGFDDAITPRTSTNTWYVMRSNGVSFDTPYNTQVSFTGGGSVFAQMTADVNGDGVDDIVYARAGAGTYTHHYHQRTPATSLPDMMSAAEDGYGTRGAFTYSPITNAAVYTKGSGTQAPVRDIAGGLWVVSRLSRTDGSGATTQTSIDFSYVGAREDGQGRGFLGFEKRTSIDNALGHNLKTIETFSQTFPTIGALKSVEAQKSTGARIAYQSNTWSAHSGGTTNQTYAYPYVSASTLDQHDFASGQKIASVQTSSTVDTASGLVKDLTRTTSEVASGLFPASYKTERIQHTSVLNDTTNWCIGRPSTTVETKSHTLNDGAAIARTTAFVWDAAPCRVTQATIEPGSSTLQLTTTYGYDAFGNVSTETVQGAGVASRTTTVNWGTSGRFPETITNALSQPTVITWDAALALPLSTTESNNLTMNWQYDVFGRRTREVRPDQTSSNWMYSACASGCVTNAKMMVLLQEKDANAVVIQSGTDYFDRWDRLIALQSHLLTANDQVWAVKREYDARGSLIRDYAPYLNGGGSGYLKLTYDAVGRVALQELIRPNQATYATTSFSYSGLQVTETDPLLRSTTRHLAAWGPVLRVTDAASGQVNYQHNAFDQLMQAADPAGNVVSRATYNIRGMRTALTDMNMGTWSFTPNALGEVVSQTDAKSQATTFQYDLLGRLKTRTEVEGVSTWTWGTSAANKNIGRLASLAGPGYSEAFTYDTYGRPSVQTITADMTYQFDYAYDSAGRLFTLTYPQSHGGVRFKTKYGYSGGFLNSVQDFTGNVNGTVLWGLNLLDARGNATSESFGNGLWVQNEFDPLTGLAITRKAGTGGQENNIQHWSHQWDAAGNLTSRQDLRQSLTESFGYDALYRLTTRTGPGGSMSIAYDSIGNITSKTGIGGTFTYHTTRKHAVTSAGGVTYSYDPNGNMTSRGGATITWSSYNLPTMINAPNGLLAQFSYTPDRARWRQVSSYAGGSTETTIYVGGLLEKLLVGGVTRWKHLIPTPSGQVQVVRRSDGTQQTLYVVTDHLGSTDAALDAAGSVAMRASFGVHGERRSSNWQGPPTTAELQAIGTTTRHGYTGHEMLDNVNLIHMNGRVFDPAIARFISPDPFVQDPFNGQNLNRYSYVLNNPLRYVDPTGFNWDSLWWDDWTFGWESWLGGGDRGYDCIRNNCNPPATVDPENGMPWHPQRRPDRPSSTPSAPGQPVDAISTVGGMCNGGAGGPCHPTPAPLPPELQTAYRVTGAIADYLTREPTLTLPDGREVPALGGTVFTPGIGSARATFVQVFRSHTSMVRSLGSAGAGRQWHHVVEQTPGNVSSFGAYAIHNTQNVIALDVGVHRQISGFYSSIAPQFTGSSTLTVRQWLSTQSLNDQRLFGEQVLRLFGVP